MKKLNPPISQVQQLQPLDLIFSVVTEKGIINQIKRYFRIRKLKKKFPDVEPSLFEFNQVRIFWGFALISYEMMCLERDDDNKPHITFLTDWVMDINNTWICRHNKVISRGIGNKESYESLIGRFYMKEHTGDILSDIHTMYQQAKIFLDKTPPESIPELMLNPKLVLINSKIDIDKK